MSADKDKREMELPADPVVKITDSQLEDMLQLYISHAEKGLELARTSMQLVKTVENEIRNRRENK